MRAPKPVQLFAAGPSAGARETPRPRNRAIVRDLGVDGEILHHKDIGDGIPTHDWPELPRYGMANKNAAGPANPATTNRSPRRSWFAIGIKPCPSRCRRMRSERSAPAWRSRAAGKTADEWTRECAANSCRGEATASCAVVNRINSARRRYFIDASPLTLLGIEQLKASPIPFRSFLPRSTHVPLD